MPSNGQNQLCLLRVMSVEADPAAPTLLMNKTREACEKLHWECGMTSAHPGWAGQRHWGEESSGESGIGTYDIVVACDGG